MNNTLDSVLKKKLEVLKKEITKPENVIILAEELKKGIYTRTKLGYGVSEMFGKQFKLPALSDDYKIWRKKHKVDSTSSASKSNLTQSGEMLNSLKVKPTSTGSQIVIDGTRNQKVKQYTEEAGRPFFYVSSVQLRELVVKLQKMISKAIKK